MKWNECFNINHMPSLDDIKTFIGSTQAYWEELMQDLDNTYQPQKSLEYSKDSLQPGWNLKVRNKGKALCALYPMPNYFIVLVVVGPKDEEKVKQMMDSGLFAPCIKELYDKTIFSPLGRWLMIEVKNQVVLKDIIELIHIRSKK